MDPAAESQKIKKMPARYKKKGKVHQTAEPARATAEARHNLIR